MGWQVVSGGGGGVESVNGDTGPAVALDASEVPFDPGSDPIILGGAEDVQAALEAAAELGGVSTVNGIAGPEVELVAADVPFDPGSPALLGGATDVQGALEFAAGFAETLVDVVAPAAPFTFDGLDWAAYDRYRVEVFDVNATSGPAEIALVGRAGGSDLGDVHRVQFVLAFGVAIVTTGDAAAPDVVVVGSLGSFSEDAEHGWTEIALRAFPGGARTYVKAESKYQVDATTDVSFDVKATVLDLLDGFKLRFNSGAGTLGRVVVTGWRK